MSHFSLPVCVCKHVHAVRLHRKERSLVSWTLPVRLEIFPSFALAWREQAGGGGLGLPVPRKAAAVLASAWAHRTQIFLAWAEANPQHNFSGWSPLWTEGLVGGRL